MDKHLFFELLVGAISHGHGVALVPLESSHYTSIIGQHCYKTRQYDGVKTNIYTSKKRFYAIF